MPHRLAESLGSIGLCLHWNATLLPCLRGVALSRKAYMPSGGPWAAQRIQELLLERLGLDTSMRFALRRQTGLISPSQPPGEEGHPELLPRHRHPPSSSRAVLSAQAAPQRGRETAPSVLHPGLLGRYGLRWGCSPEGRLRLCSIEKHPLFAGRDLGFLLRTKHTLTHFNQQEQPSVHHARGAAAHALPACRGSA